MDFKKKLRKLNERLVGYYKISWLFIAVPYIIMIFNFSILKERYCARVVYYS